MMVINGWLSESHFGGSAIEGSILKTESQHKVTRTLFLNGRRVTGTWGKKGGGSRGRRKRVGGEIETQNIRLLALINAFHTIDI